jgi:hypothetical protein
MLTPDIKKSWSGFLNVIRRLQQTGCKQDGLAIVKMTIVLNSKGEPVYWLDPDVKLIEPKNKIKEKDLETLIKVFGEELLINH